MPGPYGESPGALVLITGNQGKSTDLARTSRGPSVIVRTILPEGIRDTDDLVGLLKGSVCDILSQTSPKPLRLEGEVIDIEARVVSDAVPKIGD